MIPLDHVGIDVVRHHTLARDRHPGVIDVPKKCAPGLQPKRTFSRDGCSFIFGFGHGMHAMHMFRSATKPAPRVSGRPSTEPERQYSGLVRSVTMLCVLLSVTPTSATRADPFDAAAERYRTMMIAEAQHVLAGVHALRERVAADDLDGARQAWIDARAGWERSEVYTSEFAPDLDEAIDAWPDAVAGFHGIEAKLFGADRADPRPQIEALIGHLQDLDTRIHTMPLSAQGLLNGLTRLAYEVGESKADGGESRLSGTSLNDMRNNAEGIASAYDTLFASALAARDSRLAQAVENEIRALKSLLEVSDLRSIDSETLRKVSEGLAVNLQNAAPPLGLSKPELEGSAK